MVELLNATYKYPGAGGVKGVSFTFDSGEFILLVGRTGAGKTTLFRLISRELTVQSGEVSLDGMRASRLKRHKLPLWRRRLGIVFQELRLLPDRNALENVYLAAVCDRNHSRKPRERALRALSTVKMNHKLYGRPPELSAGEQQRVAIARALVNEPFVLIADEPVSHLDEQTAADVVDVLIRINRMGTAVLVASHQPERFGRCNPRVIRLENGEAVIA